MVFTFTIETDIPIPPPPPWAVLAVNESIKIETSDPEELRADVRQYRRIAQPERILQTRKLGPSVLHIRRVA